MRKPLVFSFALILVSAAAASAIDFPTPKHKALDKLVGSWEVDVTFRQDGRDMNAKSLCNANWILAGHFLKLEYESILDKQKFEAVHLLGFDTNKRRYLELKLDTIETGVMHNEGDMADDGRSITFTGDKHDLAGGKPMKIKTVYTFENYSKFTIDWYRIGADGKEERILKMVHLRQK